MKLNSLIFGKTARRMLLLTALCLAGTSCIFEEESFDVNLLVGKWVCHQTEYWRYFSDGTGYTWDVADDVQESEAQTFTWSLEINQLTQMHRMEIAEIDIVKTYTVLQLDEDVMVYEDSFGDRYEFDRCL